MKYKSIRSGAMHIAVLLLFTVGVSGVIGTAIVSDWLGFIGYTIVTLSGIVIFYKKNKKS